MAGFAQLLCESASCFGSGVFGLKYILLNGSGMKILKYVTFSTIGAGLVFSLIQRNRQKPINARNVILITGCDSGLGFNMAVYCNRQLNMFVCAACLSMNSEGARKILEQCNPNRLLLIELDIRKSASILHVEKTITNLLTNNTHLGDSSFSINILLFFS